MVVGIVKEVGLVDAMFWAFFLGFSATIGAGLGVAFLASFQKLLSPKEKT